jgi:hypothetical protein
MGVYCLHARIGKQARDQTFHLAAFDHIGIEHHAFAIVSTQRQQTAPQYRRNFSDPIEYLPRLLADKDRTAGAVRRMRRLMLIWQQKKAFPRVRILKADTAGKARLLIGKGATDTTGSKHLIREGE